MRKPDAVPKTAQFRMTDILNWHLSSQQTNCEACLWRAGTEVSPEREAAREYLGATAGITFDVNGLSLLPDWEYRTFVSDGVQGPAGFQVLRNMHNVCPLCHLSLDLSLAAWDAGMAHLAFNWVVQRTGQTPEYVAGYMQNLIARNREREKVVWGADLAAIADSLDEPLILSRGFAGVLTGVRYRKEAGALQGPYSIEEGHAILMHELVPEDVGGRSSMSGAALHRYPW